MLGECLLQRMDIEMTFSAERLRDLRKNAGLTQEELADKVGKRKQAIHEYEAGKRQPGSETLLALSRVLNTNAIYLLSETNYSGPIDEYAEQALLWKNHPAVVSEIARQRLLKELKDRGDIPRS